MKPHPLLNEMCQGFFGDNDPRLKELGPFIAEIDTLFENFDAARRMLEESMQLTSNELIKANKEKQAKNSELLTLYQLATMTQNISSLDDVYTRILKEIRNVTTFPIVFIVLTRENSRLLEIRLLDTEKDRCERFEIEDAKSSFFTAINTRKLMVINQALKLNSQDDFLKSLSIQTLVSVPMEIDGKIIGLLCLTDREDRIVELGQIKMAEFLSSHVGSLIVRKQNEVKLNELLRSLPDENPNPIFRVSQEGIILYANAASQDVLKAWKSREGQPLPADLISMIHTSLQNNRPGKLEIIVETKTFVLLIFPMFLGKYANLYLTDVTEIKNTEALMREQEAKMMAASKLASLGEMAGGIAHEINNPLAIIHANGNLLRDLMNENFDKAMGLKITEKIIVTTERVAKIIRGLRAISRNGDNDPFDTSTVEQIIEEALGVCREKFKVHDVTIKIENSCPLTNIECKKVQIIQVLLNFLNNAYDAIEELPERWVKIGVKENQGNIEISVVDSGPGLPPYVREKICQPFFTTKKVGKGTGLGLSISKGIIEAHKGKLSVDDACKNTCFLITLPKLQVMTESKVA